MPCNEEVTEVAPLIPSNHDGPPEGDLRASEDDALANDFFTELVFVVVIAGGTLV
jgi:hypothetical protein